MIHEWLIWYGLNIEIFGCFLILNAKYYEIEWFESIGQKYIYNLSCSKIYFAELVFVKLGKILKCSSNKLVAQLRIKKKLNIFVIPKLIYTKLEFYLVSIFYTFLSLNFKNK